MPDAGTKHQSAEIMVILLSADCPFTVKAIAKNIGRILAKSKMAENITKCLDVAMEKVNKWDVKSCLGD